MFDIYRNSLIEPVSLLIPHQCRLRGANGADALREHWRVATISGGTPAYHRAILLRVAEP